MTKEEFDALPPGTIFTVYSDKEHADKSYGKGKEYFTDDIAVDGKELKYSCINVIKTILGDVRVLDYENITVHFDTEEDALNRALYRLKEIPKKDRDILFNHAYINPPPDWKD